RMEEAVRKALRQRRADRALPGFVGLLEQEDIDVEGADLLQRVRIGPVLRLDARTLLRAKIEDVVAADGQGGRDRRRFARLVMRRRRSGLAGPATEDEEREDDERERGSHVSP